MFATLVINNLRFSHPCLGGRLDFLENFKFFHFLNVIKTQIEDPTFHIYAHKIDFQAYHLSHEALMCF